MKNTKHEFSVLVGKSMLMPMPFQELSSGAKHLYLCCAIESDGRSSFVFPQSTAKKYGIAPRSFRRYIKELIESGFILLENSGKKTRECNVYAMESRWREILMGNPAELRH